MPGWIHRLAPRPLTTARLFCFPPAGHGSAIFRLWPNGLPSSYEVCAIELPGRGARLREPPIPSIPTIVEQLIDSLLPELDRPFAFFGHSMGAVLAAAVAQSLAARGERQPSHLIVSARRPPLMFDSASSLRALADEDFVVEINRRYAGIPQEVVNDPELLAMLLPALRADVAALEQYVPAAQAPLECPITACGGTSDTTTPLAHMEAWRRETRKQFRLRLFSGGHFYFLNERVALLAEIAQILGSMLSVSGGVQHPGFAAVTG
jgi:medium-chain acyl-[acyl-carrier-protein] hydrolase